MLGHRRLSIIDLSPEANQPLLNEDGTIGVVVNGEIYNFAELREDLVKRGHVFRSNSDCEVVVHLYEEYGVDCVAKLSGMFALALWDSGRATACSSPATGPARSRSCTAACPAATWRSRRKRTRWSARSPTCRSTPDLEAIDEYLTLQYVPAPRTAYRDVFKLPAAHLADPRPGLASSTLRRYWTKPSGPELTGSEEDLARELRDLLASAVRRGSWPTCRVGAFLSGGLDSSTIVALMATQSTRPVQTFSIGFPDASDSELGWARQVAERYGTVHHEAVVTPAMTDVVVESVRHHGEPFADSSAVATYYLARETRAARHRRRCRATAATRRSPATRATRRRSSRTCTTRCRRPCAASTAPACAPWSAPPRRT